jgi:hypothetical protein
VTTENQRGATAFRFVVVAFSAARVCELKKKRAAPSLPGAAQRRMQSQLRIVSACRILCNGMAAAAT